MRQMGMSQEDIPAVKVIIKTSNEEYVFENPSVQKVKMQGQTTFQVIGDYKVFEINPTISISEDDISIVVEQAGVSKDEARKALEESKGDIALAVVNLTSN